jgi:serine/threonine-protein kinase ATR
MAAVSKSTVAARCEAAAEIIHQARNNVQRDKDKPLFHQFAVLIDQMIKLSFYPGQAKAKTVNIQSEFSALKRMMPVGVIMPLSNVKYNPFPAGDYPTISGIEDEVEILASLQRPKKVCACHSAHFPGMV